jgi:hypothetical protein
MNTFGQTCGDLSPLDSSHRSPTRAYMYIRRILGSYQIARKSQPLAVTRASAIVSVVREHHQNLPRQLDLPHRFGRVLVDIPSLVITTNMQINSSNTWSTVRKDVT